MRTFQVAAIVAFSILFFSCAKQSSVEPATSLVPTVTPQSVISAPPTATLVPTKTTTNTPQPTHTPTPAATTTPTLITDIRYQDIILENTIPPEIEGVLVMGWAIYSDNESYLLNLENGDKITIPIRLETNQVSPDRKLLAYLDGSNGRINFVSADGQPAFSYPLAEDWSQIVKWLDGEKLLIEHRLGDYAYTILNTYTGKWEELRPNIPYVSDNGEIAPFHSQNYAPIEIVFDASLSHAVVRRYSEADNQSTLELWDHRTGQIIWTKPDVWAQSIPIWSPTDVNFATLFMLASEYEDYPKDSKNKISLYLTSQDGQETKLTNNVMGGATWSPDGRYLATMWQMDMEIDGFVRGTTVLAIVDLHERNINVYTLRMGSGYPVWSPDGKYVAFDNILSIDEINAREFEVKTQVVIVDVFEKRAYKVVQDANVVGWMLQSP